MCNTAKSAISRLAKIEAPKHEDDETTFAACYQRIQKTIDVLNAADSKAFERSANEKVYLQAMGKNFPFDNSDRYMQVFGQLCSSHRVISTADQVQDGPTFTSTLRWCTHSCGCREWYVPSSTIPSAPSEHGTNMRLASRKTGFPDQDPGTGGVEEYFWLTCSAVRQGVKGRMCTTFRGPSGLFQGMW